MQIIAELEAEKQRIEDDVKNIKNRKVGYIFDLHLNTTYQFIFSSFSGDCFLHIY